MNTIRLERMKPVGTHTQNTSLSSAVTLTLNASATAILVQAFDQNIRFTLDGTAPTTSKGFQLKAGDPALLIPLEGATLKFIEEAATATLEYQFVSGV